MSPSNGGFARRAAGLSSDRVRMRSEQTSSMRKIILSEVEPKVVSGFLGGPAEQDH